jgi:hypothetical protein
MSDVKVIAITFQNNTESDVQISIHGNDLTGVLPGHSNHQERVDVETASIKIEIRGLSSLSACDEIINLEHGDNYTYSITRDDARQLKLNRKYGFR